MGCVNRHCKLLEPNYFFIWQFVTKLTYKMKCSNTRTTQYNKIPKYITNPNLEVAKRGRKSWLECTCLSWNTQKNISPHVWKEIHINNNMKHNIKTKVNSNSPPGLNISKSFYILLLSKTIFSPFQKQFYLLLNKTF